MTKLFSIVMVPFLKCSEKIFTAGSKHFSLYSTCAKGSRNHLSNSERNSCCLMCCRRLRQSDYILSTQEGFPQMYGKALCGMAKGRPFYKSLVRDPIWKVWPFIKAEHLPQNSWVVLWFSSPPSPPELTIKRLVYNDINSLASRSHCMTKIKYRSSFFSPSQGLKEFSLKGRWVLSTYLSPFGLFLKIS